MPSKSYVDFLELLIDVDRLMEAHYSFSKGKAGRKSLGYLTRSATVMLCAAWERYNENMLLECIDLILSSNIQAAGLPKDVKKHLSSKVKADKNEIFPIELADSGWKNLWKGYATNEIDALHTPNSSNLIVLYKHFLGIDDYTNFWKSNVKSKIDSFIKDRGEIAHNGSQSKYVRMNNLKTTYRQIIENAIEIDFNLSQYLKSKYLLNTWTESYGLSLKEQKKIGI